jgi:CubicO group peptidase (beta-lactamase class C family)
MPRNVKTILNLLYVALMCATAAPAQAAGPLKPPGLNQAVHSAVQEIRRKYGIPGVAVGVTVDGAHYFYNYGIASKSIRDPVTPHTLFEIGSFSKTVTGTLACYAAAEGKLSLSDRASDDWPVLRGSSFDRVSVLNLGTHTAGLSLFVPDSIGSDQQLTTYLRDWQPAHPVGSERIYSNVGIGVLGQVTANRLNQPFDAAVEGMLLPKLGMTHTYLHVPPGQMHDYAQGYTKDDAPIRLSPGAFASQAYGIRSDTSDLLRFLDVNLQVVPLDDTLRRAIGCMHTGYYTAGPFVQDLVWEQYPYPVSLDTLLAGNSPDVIYKGLAAHQLTPPLPPQAQALINKTGSTNGFSTYAAFIPALKVGVVILANRSYPIDARVTAVYRILGALANR